MPSVIPPVPDPDDQFFWDGVAEHKLLLQRCADCGTIRHPPLPMCGRCGSVARDTLESAGRGTVYSWIVSRHPTEPDAEPRTVVLVDLEEGVRIVSNLLDVPVDAIEPGLPVEVAFVTTAGVTLPQFRPAAATAA